MLYARPRDSSFSKGSLRRPCWVTPRRRWRDARGTRAAVVSQNRCARVGVASGGGTRDGIAGPAGRGGGQGRVGAHEGRDGDARAPHRDTCVLYSMSRNDVALRDVTVSFFNYSDRFFARDYRPRPKNRVVPSKNPSGHEVVYPECAGDEMSILYVRSIGAR